MSTSGLIMARGGPYPAANAGLGGLPTKKVDDPITAVFLLLFVIGAVCHMTILQVNLRRGKKFIMSGMLFGFCMARITTMTMRLVWSTHATNIRVAIAANVFVSAGVLLLFIVNLIFAQRIVRASHPNWAWSKWFSMAFKLYYATIVVMLLALITSVVQSFYTLSHNTRRIDRDIQLVGSTYFAVAAFLPIPLVALRLIIRPKQQVEKFGEGRHRSKVTFLIISSLLLSLGAAFRCGIAYVPRPVDHPAWYHSKACFYIFNFTIEIIVVYMYVLIRVDKRFHIPNGAHGPGSYTSTKAKPEAEADTEDDGRSSLADRVNDEEEVFDAQEEGERTVNEQKDLESGLKSSVAEH